MQSVKRGKLSRIQRKLGRELSRYVARKPANLPSGKKLVSFTFDDYPATARTAGAAVLEKHGVRGTFYSALGMCGQDSPSGVIDSAESVVALTERGHECGCHTFDHMDCAASSLDSIRASCASNHSAALDLGQLTFKSFAFPYGSFGPASKRVIGELYDSARTVVPGINTGEFDLAALQSAKLYESVGLEASVDWLNRLDQLDSGWLIFYTHDVASKPSSYGCSPETLNVVTELALERGFQVATVDEGVQSTTALRS